MTLEKLIKEKDLTLEDLKKGALITFFNSESLFYETKEQAKVQYAYLLLGHYSKVINFEIEKCDDSSYIFKEVARFLYEHQNKESKEIDTMPRMITIEEDIASSFNGDVELAMEFYITCSYQVV